jgi:hypothetical protein
MRYPLKDKADHFRRPFGMEPTTANIPLIDISAPDADQKEIARQLVDAAEEHGFIYIRNLGRDIEAKSIDGAFDLVSYGNKQGLETNPATKNIKTGQKDV